MAFLLDTCTLSEFVATKPEAKVVGRLLALPREAIHISAMTIGELEQGVSELKASKRKEFLRTWLVDHILPLYGERILAVDVIVARRWGSLAATLKARGRKMQIKDSLIAATALVHDLTVVTRNASDFAHAEVRILNPWE